MPIIDKEIKEKVLIGSEKNLVTLLLKVQFVNAARESNLDGGL